MNYIFKTTATMKEYNNKKWYIDGGIISDMRRDFWGYKCDIVRVGQWIYKAN